MPNVMMTFVKAIFVPATLVKILGISADNEPMLTTLIGPNFTSLAAPGALAHRLQRRTACKTQNGHQGAPKWPTGSEKGSNPRFLGAVVNFP